LLMTTLGPSIIATWTAGKVVVDDLPVFLFAVSVTLQGLWLVGSVVLVCSNKHHLLNYLYLCVTVGGLFLANEITRIYGFTGVPATMVFQDTLLIVIAILLSRSKLNHNSVKHLGSVFTFGFYRKHIKAARARCSLVSPK
jgi:hypothetical protein